MLENIIIIDNQSYPLGGTAQVAYASAVALRRREFNVVYIAADKEPNYNLLKQGVDVRVIYNPSINKNTNKIQVMKNGLWDSRMEKEISNILVQFDKQSTLIHIHGYLHCFSPSVLKACQKSEIGTILTLHDYFILCPCGGFYNFKNGKICNLKPMSMKCKVCNCDKRSYIQKIWRIIRQYGVKKYARDNNDLSLIYISEFSFSKMRSSLERRHRLFYVPNPYDIGDGRKYNAARANDYVFMGRLSREKGADIFCKAFSELIDKKKIQGNAVVVGDGDQREGLEKQYPLIRFLGWKQHKELREMYEKARALVFPSRWYECAPLTPIEFMSRGIPCIISDSNAGKDYIHDKHDGLIFKSEDVEDLKSTIIQAEDNYYWEKICSNLASTFNTKGYSVRTHVDRLIDVYKQILI